MKTIFDNADRKELLSHLKEIDDLATEYVNENPKVFECGHSNIRDCISGMSALLLFILLEFRNQENNPYFMISFMEYTEPQNGGETPLKTVIINLEKKYGGMDKEFGRLTDVYKGSGIEKLFYCFDLAHTLIMDDTWDRKHFEALYAFFEWNTGRVTPEEYQHELFGSLSLMSYKRVCERNAILSRKDDDTDDNEDYDDDDSMFDYADEDFDDYWGDEESEEDLMKSSCDAFLQEYPTPSKIKEYLDRFIIGQDDAKKLISLSVFQHYYRILHEDEELSKFNVLMIGPSGCGKTEIIRRLKEIVNLPIITADFSGIVSTPYKGRNKEDELIRLYEEAGGSVYRAERGIIFLDEFDKVCKPGNTERGYSNSDELMGQLLSMMEGSVIDTSQRSHVDKENEDITIDTKNILFVCLGAFEGLDEIIQKDSKRLEEERIETGGFGMTPIKSYDKISSKDVEVRHLIEFGVKPELAGRLCNLAVLDPIDRDMMKLIMTQAQDSAIKLFQKELLLDDGIELVFTEEALDKIADKALERGVGARAINSVVRESLTDILFEAPSMKEGSVVTITAEMI